MRNIKQPMFVLLTHDEDFYGSTIQQRELPAQGEKGIKHDIDYSGRSITCFGKFLRSAK
jgi:hypothetical protein